MCVTLEHDVNQTQTIYQNLSYPLSIGWKFIWFGKLIGSNLFSAITRTNLTVSLFDKFDFSINNVKLSKSFSPYFFLLNYVSRFVLKKNCLVQSITGLDSQECRKREKFQTWCFHWPMVGGVSTQESGSIIQTPESGGNAPRHKYYIRNTYAIFQSTISRVPW